MSAAIIPVGIDEPVSGRQLKAQQRAQDAKTKLSSPLASVIAVIIAVLWTIPTLGMLVNSVRKAPGPSSSGWWHFFGNGTGFTFSNFSQAWTGNGAAANALGKFILNTFVITIPATVIPIALALGAAYAFAWIPFRGRNVLFVAVFALQIVPIQVALVPLLKLYNGVGLAGSFWPIWLSHTMFGLPLATFLLHNFIKEIPGSLVEAARIDGAGHVGIFFRVMLPLLVPAIASFAIFQFLWVWNDLLVALTFASGGNTKPITPGIQGLTTQFASAADILPAGAMIALVVPLIVFLSLQRYFVRGLLAGSVKG
ncbi:MAG: carbohydrate ABC transporter permease [Actinomycetota bacterium]|nr:carbohydrate ABC transporter permease [Actinomycetota bacterium]